MAEMGRINCVLNIAALCVIMAFSCSPATSKTGTDCPDDGHRKENVLPGETVEITDRRVSQTGLKDAEARLSGNSSLYLTGNADEVLDGSMVTLLSDDSWLFLPGVTFSEFSGKELSDRIRIGEERLKSGDNGFVTAYYNGVYVKPKASAEFSPVELYKDGTGEPQKIKADRIYIGGEIPTGDDALSKVVLKRGFMLTLAENPDGTGAGRVYMATDEDQEIELGPELSGKVSFMRALLWNYVCKRGGAGNFQRREDMGITWFYGWSYNFEATRQMDYVPMFLGKCTPKGVEEVTGKKLVNTVLAFNEPNVLSQTNMSVEDALDQYPLILKTGLRVGSPVCGEGKWKTWLKQFMDGCELRGYRVDFIVTHWYDWANWRAGGNPSPDDIDAMVARFKKRYR